METILRELQSNNQPTRLGEVARLKLISWTVTLPPDPPLSGAVPPKPPLSAADDPKRPEQRLRRSMELSSKEPSPARASIPPSLLRGNGLHRVNGWYIQGGNTTQNKKNVVSAVAAARLHRAEKKYLKEDYI